MKINYTDHITEQLDYTIRTVTNLIQYFEVKGFDTDGEVAVLKKNVNKLKRTKLLYKKNRLLLEQKAQVSSLNKKNT